MPPLRPPPIPPEPYQGQELPSPHALVHLAEVVGAARVLDDGLDLLVDALLALALLAGENRPDLTKIWLDQVTGTFKAEMGALVWLDGVSDGVEEAPLASKLIRQGGGFSGVLRPEEMETVFGTAAAEGSAALVAIRSGEDDIGVLGVGSHDPQRYRAEDGILFLEYLAEVIGQLPASG